MKLSKKEVSAIIKHLRDGNAKTGKDVTTLLSKKFKKHIYSGTAYRALIYDKKHYKTFKYTLEKGNSFALNTDAINEFLDACRIDDIQYEGEDNTALIIEAEIKGFHLCEFLKDQFDNFPDRYHEEIEDYLGEQEILLISVTKVMNEYDFHGNSDEDESERGA